MAEIICDGKTTRDINTEIKRLIAGGETDIWMRNPVARHNLGVAILQSVKLTFDGSVGYYCAGMVDGPTVEIKGSAGWGIGRVHDGWHRYRRRECGQWCGGFNSRRDGCGS